MDNKNIDRRVRKTKKQLRQALTELLEEKSVKDITVRELSERADINRATFYLHYRDVYDMVEQIQTEMFRDFQNILNKHPSEFLNGKPLPMLIDLFRLVAENSDMCKVLIVNNGDVAFLNRLKDLVKNRCLNDWMEIFNTGKSQNFEYFYSFIVSGCIGLLQSWLENGLKESPEHMALLVEQIIMTGIKVIE
ncbi:MAG TPA: TetR/AcrR family transcriptional regulator [Thermoclostridium sp.]